MSLIKGFSKLATGMANGISSAALATKGAIGDLGEALGVSGQSPDPTSPAADGEPERGFFNISAARQADLVHRKVHHASRGFGVINAIHDAGGEPKIEVQFNQKSDKERGDGTKHMYTMANHGKLSLWDRTGLDDSSATRDASTQDRANAARSVRRVTLDPIVVAHKEAEVIVEATKNKIKSTNRELEKVRSEIFGDASMERKEEKGKESWDRSNAGRRADLMKTYMAASGHTGGLVRHSALSRSAPKEHEFSSLRNSTKIHSVYKSVDKQLKDESMVSSLFWKERQIPDRPIYKVRMTISGVRADPGRSEEQEKDKEGGGRKEGSGFSKSDEGKAISIKGDIVKVNGIRRKVKWGVAEHYDCAGTIQTVVENKPSDTKADGKVTIHGCKHGQAGCALEIGNPEERLPRMARHIGDKEYKEVNTPEPRAVIWDDEEEEVSSDEEDDASWRKAKKRAHMSVKKKVLSTPDHSLQLKGYLMSKFSSVDMERARRKNTLHAVFLSHKVRVWFDDPAEAQIARADLEQRFANIKAAADAANIEKADNKIKLEIGDVQPDGSCPNQKLKPITPDTPPLVSQHRRDLRFQSNEKSDLNQLTGWFSDLCEVQFKLRRLDSLLCTPTQHGMSDVKDGGVRWACCSQRQFSTLRKAFETDHQVLDFNVREGDR